ncbi:MAG: hypothetical protein K940chlam3_00930 [Chlamydiae bacterium]|nr:hypothetical protein [Chlamydiota bacterium]
MEIDPVSRGQSTYFNEDFGLPLPVEIMLKIFNFCDAGTLASCTSVKRSWSRLAQDKTTSLTRLKNEIIFLNQLRTVEPQVSPKFELNQYYSENIAIRSCNWNNFHVSKEGILLINDEQSTTIFGLDNGYDKVKVDGNFELLTSNVNFCVFVKLYSHDQFVILSKENPEVQNRHVVSSKIIAGFFETGDGLFLVHDNMDITYWQLDDKTKDHEVITYNPFPESRIRGPKIRSLKIGDYIIEYCWCEEEETGEAIAMNLKTKKFEDPFFLQQMIRMIGPSTIEKHTLYSLELKGNDHLLQLDEENFLLNLWKLSEKVLKCVWSVSVEAELLGSVSCNLETHCHISYLDARSIVFVKAYDDILNLMPLYQCMVFKICQSQVVKNFIIDGFLKYPVISGNFILGQRRQDRMVNITHIPSSQWSVFDLKSPGQSLFDACVKKNQLTIASGNEFSYSVSTYKTESCSS